MKAVLCVALLCFSSPVFSQNIPDSIISKLKANTFKVLVYKNKTLLKTGSGVVLTTARGQNGIVTSSCLTNAHVLDGGDSAEAVFDTFTLPFSKVDFIEYRLDYANFSVASGRLNGRNGLLRTGRPGKRALAQGALVFTMSSPSGLTQSFSSGVVSSIRNENGFTRIQFTAPISPGSSGGALVDDEGDLVGIITSQLRQAQNINFAVPIGDILASLRSQGDHGSGVQISIRAIETYRNESVPALKAIYDLLQRDAKDSAYWLMEANYEDVSRSFGLMFLKMSYELDNKKTESLLKTLNDYISIHGFNEPLYLIFPSLYFSLYGLEPRQLVLIEPFFKNLKEQHSQEIILDAILGNISFRLKDFNTAIAYFTRFNSFVYTEEVPADPALAIRIRYSSDLLPVTYEALGDAYRESNNQARAEESYVEALVQAAARNQKTCRVGAKAVYSMLKNEHAARACAVYNLHVKGCELDPKFQAAMERLCAQ